MKNTIIYANISNATNDTSSSSTYTLNQLHYLNGECSILHQQKNFSFEAGINILPVLSGIDQIQNKVLFDSTSFVESTQKVFDHNTDVAFKPVNKSMLTYHLNILYRFNYWQAGIGYYQNANSWIKGNSGKFVGNIQLQIRYKLNGKFKK